MLYLNRKILHFHLHHPLSIISLKLKSKKTQFTFLFVHCMINICFYKYKIAIFLFSLFPFRTKKEATFILINTYVYSSHSFHPLCVYIKSAKAFNLNRYCALCVCAIISPHTHRERMKNQNELWWHLNSKFQWLHVESNSICLYV